MKTRFKKYWFPIFGLLSLLFIYRFVFTHSFAKGKVLGITERKAFIFTSKVTQIEFTKNGTIVIVDYYDDGLDYHKGDIVQLIYKDKYIVSFRDNGITKGQITGSTPLPVFYDTKLMIGNASVWLYNLFCWFLLMLIVAGIRRLAKTKI